MNIRTVAPHDLPLLIKRLPPNIKTLSLDCFDTLIWRKTASPTDVFYNLQNCHLFKKLNFNSMMRIRAETKARQRMLFKKELSEVKLTDIYREISPSLSKEEIEGLSEEELLAELDVCYSFKPMIDLIRSARQNQFNVIIVSDTYFSSAQIKLLLKNNLPADVFSTITEIFCSSEYGYSKSQGLFKKVIEKLKVPAETIVHLGDNLVADYHSPALLKVNTLHFLQQQEEVADILRLQAISANIMDPAIRHQEALYNPFRPILSSNFFDKNKPETLIGYACLGPIMYAFSQYLYEEITALKKQCNSLKVLYLMRDGHLPYLASETYLGVSPGNRVQISRFAAYAASFRSLEDIENYLLDVGISDRFYDVARQLLIPDNLAEKIIKTIEKSNAQNLEFIRAIRQPNIVNIILKNSADYRGRLIRYLEKNIGLTAGDTLMLVDLGYSGTAQRRLTPVLAELNIEVTGRYLLGLRTPEWSSQYRGLLDPAHYDDRALHALVYYITLLEQLCTANEKSVVDYDNEGNAIFSKIAMSDEQHRKLERIQFECLRFVFDAKKYFSHHPIETSVLRQIALAELGRLLFLPTEIELDYLKTFEAEMNLGTEDILRVFDSNKGLSGLRRRGLLFMERPSQKTRTNYPAELRTAGIELVLSLLMQHRFALDIKLKDMAPRREILEIIFTRGSESHQTTVEAVATHDGYYSLCLPGNLAVSILFGKKYEWIQIDSAELVTMTAFVQQSESNNTIDAWPMLRFNNLSEKNGKLFESLNESGALTLTPSPEIATKEYVLRIVFRPIATQVEKQVKSQDRISHLA